MTSVKIDRDRDVLLVIDIQNDFCPGGALAVPEGDAVLPVANRLGAIFPHVVLTQDWHPPRHGSFASAHEDRQPFETVEASYGAQTLWTDHCVQGTAGAEFHPELRLPHAELILRKGFRKEIDSYSAFYENDRTTATGLAGYLRERGLKRVFVLGLALDYCVAYSALDGRREGFEVFLVEDGCRGIDLDGSVEAALKLMREAGVKLVASSEIIQ